MSDRATTHRIDVSLSVEPRESPGSTPEVAAPFCIALLGDFSARAHRGITQSGPALAGRTPMPVDRDTVNDVLASLRPELHVRLHGERDAAVRIGFAELEDFHPDRLYERLPVFEGARELRRRVTESGYETPPQSGTSGAGSLLDQIVRQSPGVADEPSPLEGGDLQSYLNRLVAPYLVPGADPRRQALIVELDAASSDGLRALLHLPEFQALEALWRGVALLAQQIESDSEVQLYLIDVSKAELVGDQEASADARSRGVCHLLAAPPAGAPAAGWGVLGGVYSFGPESADLRLLDRLGTIGRIVGAPWVAAADPRLVGGGAIHAAPDPADWAADSDERWQALRRQPDAHWVGLALPRFLLRLPYGEQSNRCDTLPFEEFADTPVHEHYLWGNPALACIALLARAIAQTGRPLYPGMDLELDGLPLHLIPKPGGMTTVPCAESWLGAQAAERLMDSGLMALMSVRDAGRVRLVRFQSIAQPPMPLAGRWFG